MKELKFAIGSQSRMTVFRKLTKLDYISSCSHSGKYYSLKIIAKFNKDGLWEYKRVLKWKFFSPLGPWRKPIFSSNGQFFCPFPLPTTFF